MAHGSESCCPDENDETMDEDGHFQGVLQFQTNTKDGSDGPCSKMEKGWESIAVVTQEWLCS